MGEPESITSTSTVVEIAPHGDVFLGLDGIQLRVCSHVLSIASKVWRVMFGLQFAEGQPIHQGKPLHLKLPEDDAEAITTISKVLHHCHQFDNPRPEPAFLPRLAIASDKYDCAMAMSQWASVQLTTMHREDGFKTNPEHLLYSAYVFDEPFHFQQITKLIVCNRPGSNGTTGLNSTDYDIPESIQNMGAKIHDM